MRCDSNCFECKYDDCIYGSEPAKRNRHEYYVRNRERINEKSKKWKEEHPERVKEISKKSYLKYKGIRDRKEYQHQYYLRKKKEHMERMMHG